MDYGMADFGQKEGREGRKEGGRGALLGRSRVEWKRREVSCRRRCCITRRRRMREKNERMRERERERKRGRKKQEQPRGRNAEAAVRVFVSDINEGKNTIAMTRSLLIQRSAVLTAPKFYSP